MLVATASQPNNIPRSEFVTTTEIRTAAGEISPQAFDARLKSRPHVKPAGYYGRSHQAIFSFPDALALLKNDSERDRLIAMRRNFSAQAAADSSPAPTIATADAADKSPLEISPSQAKRRAARSEILSAFDIYHQHSKKSQKRDLDAFELLYAAGTIEVSETTREMYRTLDRETLRMWRAAVRKRGESALDAGYRGRATLIQPDSALGKEIVSWILHYPNRAPGIALYRDLESKFFDLPHVITTKRFAESWKARHASEMLYAKSPDAWTSRLEPPIRKISSEIVRLNQRWETDFTRLDAFDDSGRRPWVAGIIDVYSRRLMVLITPTHDVRALLALLRRAILEWGVPELLVTDNGKEFRSARITLALRSAGVARELAPPYLHKAKPFMERSWRTFNHQLAESLPAPSGHNVAGAQALREGKGLAERRGQKGTGEVGLTIPKLNELAARWTRDEYGNRAHGGLAGRSPYEVAAAYTGTIRRVPSERALDLLLAPAPGADGLRGVGKDGIRLGNATYKAAELFDYLGQRVRVFFDVTDAGRIYVYRATAPYSFIAIAQDENRMGLASHEQLIADTREAKRLFKRDGAKALRRLAARINPLVALEARLDRAAGLAPDAAANERSVTHLTQELIAAEVAAKVAEREAKPNGGPSLEYLETIAAGAELLDKTA